MSGKPEAESWESSRAAEPVDFPAILFGKLSTTMGSPIGSKERHRNLQDMTNLMAPYLDDEFRKELKISSVVRDQILRNNNGSGLSEKEAVDVHQGMWLAALMRLMKRRGLLGEDWIRG